MKILVTGADGMLGNHVVRELLQRGIVVRARVQPGRHTGTLDGLDIEQFEGDLLESTQVRKALDGCEGVIHTAANTQIWPSRDRRIWAVNYEAVRILAEAVLELEVPIYVHVGTATSFSPGPKTQPGTEAGPYTDGKSMRGSFADTSLELFDKMIDFNFTGAVHMTKYALPYVREVGGSVVFVSSLSGLKGLPRIAPYGAAKMALTGFAESLYSELYREIHVGGATSLSLRTTPANGCTPPTAAPRSCSVSATARPK